MHTGLPVFPNFEKLSLSHKEVLQSVATNFPSSDFNFAGLFTWDTHELVMVSSLNENLVIRSSNYLTLDKFYSFIGDNKVDETIKTITDYAKQNGEESKLELMPESVVKHVKQAGVHEILEDRDNYDYVYHIANLVELPGGKNQKKRQQLHRFSHIHGISITQKEIDLEDVYVQQELQELITRWTGSHATHSSDVENELVALKRALDNHQVLGMRAFGVYHEGKLIAFTLFEILPGRVAIAHFDKADRKFEGVYVHLKHNLAKHLASLGVETINYEQDLGIEGLRRSKGSYHPVEFIKKYTVVRK